MVRVARCFVVFIVAQLVGAAVWAQTYRIAPEIVGWLDAKPYEGADRNYVERDLEIPSAVMSALADLGVSHLTILRNEMFARHGYVFKTPVLAAIFGRISWYVPSNLVGLNSLGPTEARNVNWIKAIEDDYDFKVISRFMSQRRYRGAEGIYYDSGEGESPLALPLDVQLALNHVFLSPSRLFRNEIYARHRLSFADPVLKKIFLGTDWYLYSSSNESFATSDMNATERVNIALLLEREWAELADPVKFSLPVDVVSIPVLGYKALFLKSVDVNGGRCTFSWPDAWTAMEEKGEGIDDHVTDVDSLVDPQTRMLILRERDPLRKLALFFQNKRYKGYADEIQFNLSDAEAPSYLREAIAALGLDWRLALRKEIHARRGARMTDRVMGPVFRSCAWYSARYDLDPRTSTRLPAAAGMTARELRNYSLLEGEELAGRLEFFRVGTEADVVCDLQGNFYFVRIGNVEVETGKTLRIGHSYRSIEEYQLSELQAAVDAILRDNGFSRERVREEEEGFYSTGC